MKPFDNTLNYMDVITCKEDENSERSLTIISTITLKPIFHRFIRYYNNKLSARYVDYNIYRTLEEKQEVCFVLLTVRELAPQLYYHFYELELEEITKELGKLKEELLYLYHKLQSESKIIIFSYFENEYELKPVIGQLSFQSVIDQMNEYISGLMLASDQFYMLDINVIIAKTGYMHFYNKLNYYHTNSPFSILACNTLAHAVLVLLAQILNSRKKCLVLDCDNVLWGGTLGEDGLEGILLGNQFIGRTYLDFQREVIRLYDQGVILCLCSKNKLCEVKAVLDQHPDMLLREKFLAAMRVNYKNKADNLRELAQELNIGLDSMVFLDDNPYEISLVNYELPEVATVLLDAKKPYHYSEILRNLEYFYLKKKGENDLVRGRQYKEQEIRLQNRSLFFGNDEYLRSLETEIMISKVDEYSIARVAELSQRTNQFNLSGKHYCIEDLKRLLEMDYEILYLRAKDKFGDMGIVASAIVRIDKDHAIIEGMFLSCRVFGRGFELALLKEINKLLLQRNINQIFGIYNRNAKNEMFQEFYSENDIPFYKGN